MTEKWMQPLENFCGIALSRYEKNFLSSERRKKRELRVSRNPIISDEERLNRKLNDTTLLFQNRNLVLTQEELDLNKSFLLIVNKNYVYRYIPTK